MNRYVLCVILVLQIYPKLSQTLENNNGNKLGDVLKNHTKSIYNSTKNQNEDENIMKQETHKLLSECGVESDNSYDDDDSYGTRRGNKRRGNNYDNFGNRKRPNRRYSGNESNNYNRYGNRNRGNRYSGNDDENNSNESTNRGNRRNNGNRNRYNNENYSDEEDSNESNQSNNQRRYNRTMSNTGYYYGDGGYHNECNDNHGYRNQWRPFGGNVGYDYGNMRRGYGRNLDMNLRAKRSNDNDDSQCVSQCVFGYLEVLDDNRVPSETLVIKWLQDHLSNDMKRIRALREARRCFARLSTSDTEDGCEFSQSLSKCLNLELE
ncbi:probable serine/threonine-protein kinase clkA [Tribolium castaneum]|uniref:Uncharacterized protein n=1 Tax=Tribolium castaneum TaxID=7070 RepID=D6WPX0_TRICA|nr:PREDICTED: probable serine/threonine-protein kinase clkA [Tribolium castaneum]EFA06162.1 hypothetical protein TcasGA2_TC009008 [Tribolium castaneum]|eukprot:XP_001812998.2 PREDICTED: probable serine/threonine-protein kinase clkA [Tribolium castaneum]